MSYYWFNRQELLRKAKKNIIIVEEKIKLLNVYAKLRCYKTKSK